MLDVTRLSIASDLSESAVIYAANNLLCRSADDSESGINWSRLRLVSGVANQETALHLVGRFGLSVTLVPDDMLRDKESWALTLDGGSRQACVWSEGA